MPSSNGNNGDIGSTMTGSFRYRICSVCSVNWVLSKVEEKCCELIVLCDKYKKTNSLSKTWAQIEHISNNDSSDYSNNKRECDATSESGETRPSTFNALDITDNLPLPDTCTYDYDDNSRLNTNNIHKIPTSLNTDRHCSPVSSNNSDVKSANDIFSELMSSADYTNLDKHYVDDSLSVRCLNDHLISATDITPSSELKIISVKTMDVSSNHNELVSIKTCRDNVISTDKTSIKRPVEMLDVLRYKCSNIEQSESPLPTQIMTTHASNVDTHLKLSGRDSASQTVSHPTVSALHAATQQSIASRSQVRDISSQPSDSASQTVNSSLMHSCSDCFQQFATRIELMKHELVHRPGCGEKCGICHEMFATEDILAQHYLSHHFDQSNKTYTCIFCPFATIYVFFFISHVRLHSLEKPFVCNQCGKRCISKDRLAEHVNRAHQNKIYNKVDTLQETVLGSYDETSQPASVLETAVTRKTSGASKSVGYHPVGIPQPVSQFNAIVPPAVSQQTKSAIHAVSHTMCSSTFVSCHSCVSDTITLLHDEINVNKYDPSLSLKKKYDSSFTLDGDSVNSNLVNHQSSYESCLGVDYTDVRLNYTTPDLILLRIDDSYNTRQHCCHQCRVCPKIFQHTTDVARHERTHTADRMKE